jgi:tetratricopeptide (TPR) repeat protein
MKYLFVLTAVVYGPLSAQIDSVLFHRAAAHVEAGRTDSAIAGFEAVLSYKTSRWRLDALLSLGRIAFESLGDFRKALRYYDNAYVEYFHQPGRAHAVFMLGYIYANALKDYRRAEGYYTEFLRLYPDHELVPSVRFELEHLGRDIDGIVIPDDP